LGKVEPNYQPLKKVGPNYAAKIGNKKNIKIFIFFATMFGSTFPKGCGFAALFQKCCNKNIV